MPQLRSERGASIATQAKVQPCSAEDAVDPGGAYFKLKPGPGRSAQDVRCHQQARIHSAMVDVVAERGYDAATVRRLAQRAGVSTRTFYQHYSSKEECFLRTQKLIARRWLERVAASQEADCDGEMRLWLGARALLQAWVEWPVAARLMFVDAWAASPGTLARSRHSIRAIAAKCIGPDVDGSGTVSLVAAAGIAGLAAMMRSRLIRGESIEIEDELLEWVASCSSLAACEVLVPGPIQQIASSNVDVEDETPAPGGDRALLVSAVSKLAATEHIEALTPKKISDAAGVSRRKFHSAFSSLDDCVIAAVEWRTHKIVNRVSQHCNSSFVQLIDAHRAANLLCDQISGDAALANLCFGQIEQAGALQLYGQERMAEMIGPLIPGEPAGIASEASAFSILDLLHSEVTSRRTVRFGATVPALACLLLAPAIKRSKAVEMIDQQNHMAAA